MAKYWNNGKVADLIRGTKKLSCGTSGEWRRWENEASTAHPIRYWIAERGIDYVQDIVKSLPDAVNAVRFWLNNRFLTRTHALTSNLKRGGWYDLDTRILHSLFDELVNYVEIDKAWMNVAWSKEAQQKHQLPWWRKQWYTRWLVQWRSPEAGIDHLEWEMSLTNDWADEDSESYGQPTPQSAAAKEIFELYKWWKNVRPLRQEPMDFSGWSAYCDHKDDILDVLDCDKTDGERERVRRMLDITHILEERYDQEDEEMLIRLIKIRRSLWT